METYMSAWEGTLVNGAHTLTVTIIYSRCSTLLKPPRSTSKTVLMSSIDEDESPSLWASPYISPQM